MRKKQLVSVFIFNDFSPVLLYPGIDIIYYGLYPLLKKREEFRGKNGLKRNKRGRKGEKRGKKEEDKGRKQRNMSKIEGIRPQNKTWKNFKRGGGEIFLDGHNIRPWLYQRRKLVELMENI